MDSFQKLVAQVSAPVRWEDVVRRLASAGVRAYVEVGPGAVLSGLVKKIDRASRVLSFEAPDQLDAVRQFAADARSPVPGTPSAPA